MVEGCPGSEVPQQHGSQISLVASCSGQPRTKVINVRHFPPLETFSVCPLRHLLFCRRGDEGEYRKQVSDWSVSLFPSQNTPRHRLEGHPRLDYISETILQFRQGGSSITETASPSTQRPPFLFKLKALPTGPLSTDNPLSTGLDPSSLNVAKSNLPTRTRRHLLIPAFPCMTNRRLSGC